MKDDKYIDLLRRAHIVRHWIHENPGTNFREIRKALFPMECPIMWLYRKSYLIKIKDPEKGMIYFVQPMEKMREFVHA